MAYREHLYSRCTNILLLEENIFENLQLSMILKITVLIHKEIYEGKEENSKASGPYSRKSIFLAMLEWHKDRFLNDAYSITNSSCYDFQANLDSINACPIEGL